ncbi:hypothetical protein ACNUIP_05885 [Pseudomonas aeruginosa]
MAVELVAAVRAVAAMVERAAVTVGPAGETGSAIQLRTQQVPRHWWQWKRAVRSSQGPNKCQGTGGGGTGQCDPAKDPNKCQGGSSISGDGDCKVAIQCNGDAIQCAIVRQEKAARCADEEFRTVDDKKIQDLKNTLAGEFSGPEYEPIKATGENTHDLSKLLDTSGRFSKACPVIPDFSFPWFGSTQTVSLSSVSSDLCAFFQWFGYLLVAFAMRAAAEIIARGLN